MMNRLLTNLLLYTKPDCSHAKWHETEAFMLDALTLAAHAVASTRVEIRLEVNPDAARMWCDAGQMKQVLLNLILNSIHAMPEGGTLTLTARLTAESAPGGPGVCLSVSDTGVGIPSTQRSRIFDPFFTTRDEGTGLGLAIVHAIVEAHRGRIDVESAERQGTTFTIILPNRQEPGRRLIHNSSSSILSGKGHRPAENLDEERLVEEETSA